MIDRVLFRALVAALVAVFFVSCDGGLVDPDESQIIDTGAGVVGTLGGTVYVSSPSSAISNATVIIPVNALTEPVEIRISEGPSDVTLPNDPTAVLVRFEPEGLQFQTEVRIGLSFAGRASTSPLDYAVVHYDPETGTTTYLPTVASDASAQMVYATTTHFSLFALEAISGGIEYGTLSDSRNAKTYRTVVIGTQTWMADNLNYPNGQGTCYAGQTSQCDTFGYLYTWQGARSACPSGWHLPTDVEWQTLERFLGVEEIFLEHPNAYRGSSVNVGGRMKDTRLWKEPNEGATNETGFSALPGDYGHREGTWDDPKWNEHANFWTATESPTYPDEAWQRELWSRSRGIQRGLTIPKAHRLSVRCVEN